MTPVIHEWFARHLTTADLVALGDTVATIAEWARALDIPDAMVRSRIANGDMAFQALRPAKASRASVEVRHDNDPEAMRFVDEHPGGAERQEVGEFFGLSSERIRQIEASALQKMREAMGVTDAVATVRESKAVRVRELISKGITPSIIAERVGVTARAVRISRGEMRKAS